MSASPPRQASQRKRKRQVVQSEDEEDEYKTPEPAVGASTPPGWQTNTERRPVKAPKSKSKPRTSMSRSSKRGKKAPPSDDESESAEGETQGTEADDEPTGKVSSKSPAKEKVKEKGPDGERTTKRPRLAPGTAGGKLKRQASSASVKSAKKAPNVGASGSEQQTPAKPPLPVGEGKTTGVASESVGRPVLPSRRDTAVATQELDMNDPETWSSLLKKDKDKDKDKSKDDSTCDPLTKYGYDLSRKERADRRNAELTKMKVDYSAQKAASKKPPFDLQAQNRKIHHVQDRLRKTGSRVCPNVLASAISSIHPEWFPPGVRPPT